MVVPARRHRRALLQVLLEGRADVARNLGEILRVTHLAPLSWRRVSKLAAGHWAGASCTGRRDR